MRAGFNRFIALVLVSFPLAFACSSTEKDDKQSSPANQDDKPADTDDGSDGGSCVVKLGNCNQNADCCGYKSGDNYCVNTGSQAICAIACTSGSECASGCCAALKGGGSVCAPVEYCPNPGCHATSTSCTKNGDCCDFGSGEALCVSGVCAATCNYGSECKSGCCAPLNSGAHACGPASVCG